jgi:hypothetical protein
MKSSKLLGSRNRSKLRSLSTIDPVRPLSELTPTPNIRLPVLVSCTLTSTSLNGLSGIVGLSITVTVGRTDPS